MKITEDVSQVRGRAGDQRKRSARIWFEGKARSLSERAQRFTRKLSVFARPP